MGGRSRGGGGQGKGFAGPMLNCFLCACGDAAASATDNNYYAADGDVDWLSGGANRKLVTSLPDPRRRDVFLGGSCGSSRWRDEVAVPLLLLVVHIVLLIAV